MAEEKDVPTNLILQLADGRYAKLPDDQLESFVIPDEEVEALLRESGREAAFPEAARVEVDRIGDQIADSFDDAEDEVN